MRTERFGSALLVAALLTVGSAMPAATQVPAPPEPPSAAAIDGAGSGIVITGNHTVAAGETVDGMVVVGGNLRVEGEVTASHDRPRRISSYIAPAELAPVWIRTPLKLRLRSFSSVKSQVAGSLAGTGVLGSNTLAKNWSGPSAAETTLKTTK